MQISYFNYLFDLHGISVGSYMKARELMAALSAAGHQVHIHWQRSAEPVPGVTESRLRGILKKGLAPLLHEPNQILKNRMQTRRERRILAAEKPDLVISRLEAYVDSSIKLAKRMGIPLLVEADSPVTYELSHFDRRYIRFPGLAEALEIRSLKEADRIFCVSHVLKTYFVDRGIDPEKIRVITNGADTRRFSPDVDGDPVRRRFSLFGKTVIGFVGSFHYWHGVDNLKAVIGSVLKKHHETAFLLVGSGGPKKEELMDFIRSRGWENRVSFPGYIRHEEIPSYLAAMDIVLAPYPPLEFFYYSPVKLYEYMAMGKAVVTSRIGQIEEVIEDGRNGLLCPPGDTSRMQDAVGRLISDPDLRKVLGEGARRTATERYTWNQKARELENLCRQMLGEACSGNVSQDSGGIA